MIYFYLINILHVNKGMLYVGKVTELAGTPNVSDFIPALRWMDPQRIRKRTLYHVDKASGIAREFIEERMAERNNVGSTSDSAKDFLDVLLEFRGEETASPFPLKTINNVVVVSIRSTSPGKYYS